MGHRARAVLASILFVVAAGAALPALAASPSPSPASSPSPSPSPASSPSPSPSPTSSPSPAESPESGSAADPSPSPEPEPSPSPSPEPEPELSPAPVATPLIDVSSSTLLGQVGGTARFTVTLSNPSEEDLHDVAVVGLVPSQLRVAGVPFPDGVDAVQLGEHRGQQDIVWVLSRLGGGDEVRLPWTGRVTAGGDLRARHEVEVRVSGEPVAQGHGDLYLGRASLGSPSNPSVRSVTHRVELVAVSSEAARSGAPLAATGAPAAEVALIALVLIAGGCLLWATSRRRPKTMVSVLAVALALSGCVSSTEPPRSAGETPEDDRVGGLRIEREQPETDEEAPGTEAESEEEPEEPLEREADEPSAPAPVAAPPPAPELVRRVVPVVTTEADLPLATLSRSLRTPARDLTWDDEGGRLERPESASGDGLSFSVTRAGRGLEATVTLQTGGDPKRTRVSGRFVYEIRGREGTARLVSSPVEAVMTPGGSISVRFQHRLPSGQYEVEMHFLAG